MDKLTLLRKILNIRLKWFIKKWTVVEVMTLPDTIVIKWTGRTDHSHTLFHIKEIPVSDMDKYIQHQKSKLLTDFKKRENKGRRDIL